VEISDIMEWVEWAIAIISAIVIVIFFIRMFKMGKRLQEIQDEMEKIIQAEGDYLSIRLMGTVIRVGRKAANNPCFIGISDQFMYIFMMSPTYDLEEKGLLRIPHKKIKCSLKNSVYKNQYIVKFEADDMNMNLRIHKKWPGTNLQYQEESGYQLLKFLNNMAVKTGGNIIESQRIYGK
jgi:hypothetical protein